MPIVELNFDRISPEKNKIRASLTIDKILLDENSADVTFSIQIGEAYNNLQILDNLVPLWSKLILKNTTPSDGNTVEIMGGMRINKNNLTQFLNSYSLIEECFISKIDPKLKQAFTVQSQYNQSDAQIEQDSITVKRQVRFHSGVQHSAPGERIFTKSNVPFVSFLYCVLKEFLDDKDASLGTVPKSFLESYNSEKCNMVNMIFLQDFLERCEIRNIPVELKPYYHRVLQETREKMVSKLDSLLAKTNPRQPSTVSAESSAAPAAPGSSSGRNNSSRDETRDQNNTRRM